MLVGRVDRVPYLRRAGITVSTTPSLNPFAFVFELLALDNTDQRDQPYQRRRRRLEKLLDRRLRADPSASARQKGNGRRCQAFPSDV